MLSSLSRLTGKDHHHGERSPFSSPFSGRLSTPVAARRSSLEERRRPAYFNRQVSPSPASPIGEEDDENDDDGDDNNDEDLDADEDGGGETSPLLPIFSAAHLGRLQNFLLISPMLISNRCSPCVQPHSLHPPPDCATMRDNAVLGSATVAPSLPIPCETHTAANTVLAFLKRDHICFVGKLSTIQKGGATVSWQQRQQQDSSLDR